MVWYLVKHMHNFNFTLRVNILSVISWSI